MRSSGFVIASADSAATTGEGEGAVVGEMGAGREGRGRGKREGEGRRGKGGGGRGIGEEGRGKREGGEGKGKGEGGRGKSGVGKDSWHARIRGARLASGEGGEAERGRCAPSVDVPSKRKAMAVAKDVSQLRGDRSMESTLISGSVSRANGSGRATAYDLGKISPKKRVTSCAEGVRGRGAQAARTRSPTRNPTQVHARVCWWVGGGARRREGARRVAQATAELMACEPREGDEEDS